MKTATIIGSGNVATTLGKGLLRSGIQVLAVFSRDLLKAKRLADTLHARAVDHLANLPEDSDLYMIVVSDKAIEEVSDQISGVNGIVVHTSGTASLETLKAHKHRGVFYPLQTLTSGTEIPFQQIPILMETALTADMESLKMLASALGSPVYEVNSEQRRYIHLSAVFVNNFTNHIYHIAEVIMKENGLPFDMLKPLIIRTAGKIAEQKPSDMQTGPAKRGDASTMERHLSLLNGHPEYKQLYELMSSMISREATDSKKD